MTVKYFYKPGQNTRLIPANSKADILRLAWLNRVHEAYYSKEWDLGYVFVTESFTNIFESSPIYRVRLGPRGGYKLVSYLDSSNIDYIRGSV